ncbi:MAG TPA: hypothetical protein VH373_06720 [Jatrophihabitantaceae bacterium]|jgi:hypothetical protein
MLPVAADIAANSVRDLVGSARPEAPVMLVGTPRESRLRRRFVTFLRASAQRRDRLADRLEPRSGSARIALGR